MNIAWTQDMMGNAEYMAAFDHVVMPIAREYDPALVLVACGFDAARGDPLGGCDVTPAGYAHMTAMLQTLASGRVVVALEVCNRIHIDCEKLVVFISHKYRVVIICVP